MYDLSNDSTLEALAKAHLQGGFPEGSPAHTRFKLAYDLWRARQQKEQIGSAAAGVLVANATKASADERAEALRKQAKKAAKALKKARKAAALASPSALEAQAHAVGMRTRAKAVAAGGHVDPISDGWVSYRSAGGRLGLAAWRRKVEEAS